MTLRLKIESKSEDIKQLQMLLNFTTKYGEIIYLPFGLVNIENVKSLVHIYCQLLLWPSLFQKNVLKQGHKARSVL